MKHINKYTVMAWRERALKFARSLKGRPHTQDELEWKRSEFCKDSWDYFRVFGIQPETQSYIDKTIELLEAFNETDPNFFANEVVYSIRLKWSAVELKDKEKSYGID